MKMHFITIEISINKLRGIVGRLCSEHVCAAQKFASPNHDKEEDLTIPDKWEG